MKQLGPQAVARLPRNRREVRPPRPGKTPWSAMLTCWKIDGLKMLTLIFGGTGSAETGHIWMIGEDSSQKGGAATMKPPNEHETVRVHQVRINLPRRHAPGVGFLHRV